PDPCPRSTCRLAALPLVAGISDPGCQCAVSLALHDGSELVVRLRCVTVESREPVLELGGRAHTAIIEAIEIELGGPAIRQSGDDADPGITKNKHGAVRPLRRTEAQGAADLRRGQIDIFLELSTVQVEVALDLCNRTVELAAELGARQHG